MAGTIVLPRAPETGLNSLANVILGAVTGMADRRRAADREERLRQERLQDIQEQRDYQRGVVSEDRNYAEQLRTRLRQEGVQDEERRRNEARLDLLEREGYILPGQRGDPTVVATAAARAQRDGLFERYKDLIDAGVGLNRYNIDDPNAVEAARGELGIIRAGEAARLRGLPGQAQARADALVGEDQRLAQEDAAIAARENALDAALSAPQPRPSQGQIQARAVQLAQAASPGKTPSRDDIAAQVSAAEQEISQQLMINWSQDRQDALIQRQILSGQRANIARSRQDIRAQLNTIATQFRVLGNTPEERPPSPAPVPTAANVRAPSVDRSAAEQNALASLVTRPAPAAGRNSPAIVQPPVREPAAVAQPETNPFLSLVTEPTDVRDPNGRLIQSAEQIRLGRNTDRMMDFGRSAVDFVANLLPASMAGSTEPTAFQTVENNPAMRASRIQQLQNRLRALRVPGSKLEADLRFELEKLQRGADQAGTAATRAAAVPTNTSGDYLPPWGYGLRLEAEPGY